jgi:hypothetical protein
LFDTDILTSLKEIETPGNFDDCTVVTSSGVGGNPAANAVQLREHAAHKALDMNMIVVRAGV